MEGGVDGVMEPKIVSFSRAFIMVINLITCIGGLALTGLGAYVEIEYNAKFSQLLSQNAAIGLLVTGILIALCSCFGLYALIHSQKYILMVYFFVILALLVTLLSVLGLIKWCLVSPLWIKGVRIK